MENCRNTSFKRHLIDILFITTFSFVSSLFFTWGEFGWEIILPNIIYSFLIGTSLWKGSELVSKLVSSKIDLAKNVRRAILVMSLALFAYILLAILIINFLWITLMFSESFYIALFKHNFYLVLVFQFVVAVIINMIFYIISFVNLITKNVEEQERIKREKLAFEFQALQNQVNPHFLFNSLNSLGVLIETDPKMATRFLNDFAGIFRYSLEKSNEDLITISEELKFVNSYLSIYKVRFQDMLNFEISAKSMGYVMPMSVQMLVENSIKHNVISSSKPLTITIQESEGFLVVENNYNPKSELSRQKSNITKETSLGLKNLESRYMLKFNKQLLIHLDENVFKVSLPIIYQKDEKNESVNN